MADKLARYVKWHPAIGVTLAALLCVVSGWVVYRRLTTSAIAPAAIDVLPLAQNEVPQTAAQPTTAPSAKPAPTPTQPAVSSNKRAAALRYGVLRVGNPTDYPVRVALLSQKGDAQKGGNGAGVIDRTGEPSRYEVPAHWDFAPAEGGANGLLVSLPDRTLKLKEGDVLVAFAQDGSGRYWGPYVVNETAVPEWNAKAVEWQLILQP